MAKWQPEINDAVAFATVRWHLNRLENRAIQAYVNDKGRFREIIARLKEAGEGLKTLQSYGGQCNADEECPDTWRCLNHECQPDQDL